MRTRVLASLALSLLVAPARAQQPFELPSFRYCAPPVRPNCVDDQDAYADAERADACKRAVDRFVSSVYAYRTCLNTEMERAVRQTNETIQLFRCRARGDKNCSPP